ncbi:hypothetical protein BDV98DRAFT_605968 [Pterulicium gracile]|uniref:Zn(2)-C6 fungal-type domain-containing protein n=1 Tax=Pterulicium gracile TaxID=1884261 RepID=A0A5C3QBH5_9AGAR|nr:hypothetical protein BDV98DRAFT_605968 [Pterula gracilis]
MMSHRWPIARYSPSSSAASSQADLSPGFHFSPLPADASTSLHRSNSGRSSASNNSATSTPDTLNVQSQSKGGCWTCRIRRKRCDEIRESGSCHTCSRLGINCLGWGTQKPDWMRNKQCVDAYKAEIKAHLTRAGLIRGQPRTAALRLQPVSIDTLPYPIPPVVAMTGSRRSSTTNGQAIVTQNPRHSYPVFNDLHSSRRATTFGFSDTNIYQLPTAAHSEPAFINKFDRDFATQIHLAPPQTIAAPYVAPLPNESRPLHQSFPDIPYVPTLFPFEFGMGPETLAQDDAPSLSQDYVHYYFENVAKLCKYFGIAELNELTYSLILQDPNGCLATTISALATCHEARIHGDEQKLHISRRLYDEACQQLSSSRMLSPYSEYQAFAAIHLISYSIFSGSSVSWRWSFDVLVEWVSHTGILNQDQPSLALQAASKATRSAILLTLWIDSVSSLPLQSAPQFLTLSRAIFQDDSPYGAACNVHLQELIGCSGAILIAFAETAFLGHWKVMHTQHLGFGVYEELIRRRRLIEDQFYRNKQRTPMLTSQTSNFVASIHVDRGFRLLFDLNLRVVCGNLTVADSASIANAALELAATHPLDSPYSMIHVVLVCGLLVEPAKRDIIRQHILVGQWPFSNSQQVLQELEAAWATGRDSNTAEIQHFIGRIFSTHLVL